MKKVLNILFVVSAVAGFGLMQAQSAQASQVKIYNGSTNCTNACANIGEVCTHTSHYNIGEGGVTWGPWDPGCDYRVRGWANDCGHAVGHTGHGCAYSNGAPKRTNDEANVVKGTATCYCEPKTTPPVIVVPPAVNGSCGSSNGQVFDTKPTSGLCSSGSASSVSGNGPWTWTCSGSNGGSTASCSAGITPMPECGSSHEKKFSDKPTSGLCSVGTASSVSGSGPWNWTCVNGARDVDCEAEYAQMAINIDKTSIDNSDTQTIDEGADAEFKITVVNTGEEVLANVMISDKEASMCDRSGSQTRDMYDGDYFDPGESFTYTCVDKKIDSAYTNVAKVVADATTSTLHVSDTDDSRVEIRNKTAPNCGSSNGQTFSSKPTSGLCSVGTASSVSGSGPWNWTCTNDGQTVSCSAYIASQPQPKPEEPEEKEEKDGAIGNLVWNDLNKNCIQDPGEEGIVGVKMKLYNGNDVDTDRTNTQGRYKFKDLKKGTYKIVVAQETLPEGCYQVCDPDGTKMDGKTKVKIKGDEYHRKADFGYYCQSTPTAPTTSPSTGPGAVAGTISFIAAALSAGYVRKRHAQDVK